MHKIQYEIYVEKDIDFVFNNIFQVDVFREWTKSFTSPSSHYEGEFKKESPIKFLDDTNSGIGGIVSEYIKNKCIVLSLSYEVHEGKKVYFKEPSSEIYNFASTMANNTVITIDLNYPDDFYDMMQEMAIITKVEIKKALENL